MLLKTEDLCQEEFLLDEYLKSAFLSNKKIAERTYCFIKAVFYWTEVVTSPCVYIMSGFHRKMQILINSAALPLRYIIPVLVLQLKQRAINFDAWE